MIVGETNRKMSASFTQESVGPNPYYRCRHCGSTVPGTPSLMYAHLELPQHDRCPRRKQGEYDALKCCRGLGHDGDCNWVLS